MPLPEAPAGAGVSLGIGEGVGELVGVGSAVSVAVGSGVSVSVGTGVGAGVVVGGGVGVGELQAARLKSKTKRARQNTWGLIRGMGLSANEGCMVKAFKDVGRGA